MRQLLYVSNESNKAMRMVIQRVTHARVEVNGKSIGAIGAGLLLLLAVAKGDSAADADYLLEKTLGLRIFPDEAGKMNRNIVETGGSLLVVSQFTLYGDVRRGRRPSFDLAAAPADAERLYNYFVAAARERGIRVQTGQFQAMMDVHLVNFGPVTIFCESPKKENK
jgi:D-tyrosyl-tRNA(Tyr) deacylase